VNSVGQLPGVKHRVKFPKINRGDVFTLGMVDAFGLCIKSFSYGFVSAFFLDQSRINEDGYISIENIAFMHEHTEWGFLTESWDVKRNIELSDHWHDPIRIRDAERAFMGSMDLRKVEGAEISRYRLTCDQGLTSSRHIEYSLCQIVLAVDANAGRRYQSPHITPTVPQGFEEYCLRNRAHWEWVLSEVYRRDELGKTRAEMYEDGEL
jgi:hypothetical protein